MLNYGNFIPSSSSVGIGNSNYRWWNMQAPLVESSTTYTQFFNFDLAVNILPIAAYQKIYQDFFRWSQWESSDPTSYNFDWYSGHGSIFGSGIDSAIPFSNDYWKRDNLFSLRYCNWNKDLFMGILPNSQFGDIAVIDVSGSAVVPGSTAPVHLKGSSNHGSVVVGAQISNPNNCSIKPASGGISTGDPLVVDIPSRSFKYSNSFSILALRQAEALQKWKEITQSVDTNYRDQIKAHFGVNVPQSESHMARYIGGVARNLDISEVVNNFLPGPGNDSSQAYIYGKGVGSGQGSMTFNTGSGYYMLMCVYHAVPLLDYAISGPDGQNLVTSVEDLPIPEFDNIGMESVPAVEDVMIDNYTMLYPNDRPIYVKYLK